MENLPNPGFVGDRAGTARALALKSFDTETGPFGSKPQGELHVGDGRVGRKRVMGRALFLFAAIPLVAAGYFVRDSDLLARGKLFVQAHLVGSGATEVVRPTPSNVASPHDPLPHEAVALFRNSGKEPRADRVAALERAQTVRKRPEAIIASMTPQPPAQDLQNGPTTTAVINRTAKGPRLDPPAGSQVLLSHVSASAPDLGDGSKGVDRASAAILMMAPTAKFGFVDGDEVEDNDPIAWPGRLHLASLKPEDSDSLFGGFTEQEFRARELRCMTAAIYFEARGEPRRGQIAVAQVVMNRVRANVYPDTICGVIFQGQWNRNACQFSFACDGKPERPNNKALWERSKELAREVMRGEHWLQDIGYATHYHATYVRPHWARHFNRVQQIGQHIFYKAPDIRVRVADVMDED